MKRPALMHVTLLALLSSGLLGATNNALAQAWNSGATANSPSLQCGKYADDKNANLGEAFASGCPAILAQAAKNEPAEKKPLSPECAKFAQDKDADLGEVIRAGCQPTLAQMSKLMDNPLGNVAMLFTQFDLYKMENRANGTKANQGVYMGIAQFPKRLNNDWNLINRIVWTVPSVPLDKNKITNFTAYPPGGGLNPAPGSGPAPIDLFDGRTTGFGDMYYVGLFSPSEGKKLEGGGSFLWGAGFDLGFPTASEDILGQGKWTAGPSALGVYMGPKWKVGGLVQQYWDYAGDDDKPHVNTTNLQYFVFYSLDDTSAIGAAPNIICDWKQSSNDRCTVPVGLGYSKTVQFGKVPVRFGVEVHYSVVRPDDIPAPKWNFRFYVIPAAPSALFSWMQ